MSVPPKWQQMKNADPTEFFAAAVGHEAVPVPRSPSHQLPTPHHEATAPNDTQAPNVWHQSQPTGQFRYAEDSAKSPVPRNLYQALLKPCFAERQLQESPHRPHLNSSRPPKPHHAPTQSIRLLPAPRRTSPGAVSCAASDKKRLNPFMSHNFLSVRDTCQHIFPRQPGIPFKNRLN
jgi:hypothetical protein